MYSSFIDIKVNTHENVHAYIIVLPEIDNRIRLIFEYRIYSNIIFVFVFVVKFFFPNIRIRIRIFCHLFE
jgi:hypothetical protein